jgi:hypothetical protein
MTLSIINTRLVLFVVTLIVIILSVSKLNVVILSVVAQNDILKAWALQKLLSKLAKSAPFNFSQCLYSLIV